MSKATQNFRETDLRRVVRSVEREGLKVVGLEMVPKTGGIKVLVANGETAAEVDREIGDQWDAALK